MKIGILAGKGGTGKTTIALALAHNCQQMTGRPCYLIDLDSQKSAEHYSASVQAFRPLTYTVTDRLPTDPEAITIIDYAPDVIEPDDVDLVVIVTDPSRLSINAIKAAAISQKSPIIITNKDPKTSTTNQLYEALQAQIPHATHFRVKQYDSLLTVYAHHLLPSEEPEDKFLRHILSNVNDAFLTVSQLVYERAGILKKYTKNV